MRRFFYIILGLSVFLLGGETGLRVFSWTRDFLVQRDLIKQRKEQILQNEFVFYQYDSLLGWRNRPGVEGRLKTLETTTEIRINRHGLRDRDYPYQKGAERRILVLGDYTVWGYGVEQEESFPKRLEKSLSPSWEVINAGTTGYSTDQELLYLRQEGLKYSPDVVLVVFSLYDTIENISQVAYSYPKPFFVLEGKSLRLANVPVPKKSLKWEERLGLPSSQQFVLGIVPKEQPPHSLSIFLMKHSRLYQQWAGKLQDPVWKEGLATSEALLLEMRHTIESNGARCMIVLLPSVQEVERGFRSRVSRQYEQFFLAHHFNWIDSYARLRREFHQGRSLFFVSNSHLNAEGHALLAAIIREAFVKQGLLAP